MTTLGVIVGTRGFFPAELCAEGRERILRVLREEGFAAVALTPEATPYGSVESLEDAEKVRRRSSRSTVTRSTASW